MIQSKKQNKTVDNTVVFVPSLGTTLTLKEFEDYQKQKLKLKQK